MAKINEAISTTDEVEAVIVKTPTAPRYPCPRCGSESKRRSDGSCACVACGHEHAAAEADTANADLPN